MWKRILCTLAATGALMSMTDGAYAETVQLSQLDVQHVTTDWGTPQANRSIDGNPLSIGGEVFEHGIGTHASSMILLELAGGSQRFRAIVGVDDEAGEGRGSMTFSIYADGIQIWTSGIMRGGEGSKPVDIDIQGVNQLRLVVGEAGDHIHYDHADWAMATLEVTGAKPRIVSEPVEEPYILTPKPPREPRINGARVFGVRTGHPFLFTIPATGDRPMTFGAEDLPDGLQVDPQTGRIDGQVAKGGEYHVTLTATNTRGSARRDLRIVVGDQIALTPPMGWNSWNCFAHAIDADKVKAAADAMVASELAQHGWQYINIDDYWERKPSAEDDPTLQGPGRDEHGRIVPNPRFPDMKGLCDYVHSLGLKVGIYSSPGPYTCGGCLGSYDHEDQDAMSYAEWGIDYLKYDWCTYHPEQEAQRGQGVKFGDPGEWWLRPRSKERSELMQPYHIMRAALDKVPRDIVYSLCQYGMGKVWEWGAQTGGNCWRTTGDIVDTWGSMAGIGFGQAGQEQYAGPGHWNDPDMLVVGQVGWGPDLHPTRLTPNEQYTHISLWCLLASPLLIGCDMTRLDEFTLSLLTNDEVLEVNQDPLGRQASRRFAEGDAEVWAKEMEDGSLAVGLFNRGWAEASVTADWAALGLHGAQRVQDLWRQQDNGVHDGHYEATVPRHGCVLVRMWPED